MGLYQTLFFFVPYYENAEDIEDEKLFIDEETTSIKDISDFEKQMRKDAKKIHCPIFSLNHI